MLYIKDMHIKAFRVWLKTVQELVGVKPKPGAL